MKKATREQTKAHNKNLVLNAIYAHCEISRADLARITHLTRSTVSEIVTELIDDGLIKEIGLGESAGGKPPILLCIESEANHVLGIDLASGEFRGAVINLRGEIKNRVDLSVENITGEEALLVVYQLIDRLLELTDRPILGIGIGAPGLMDTDNGVVRYAVNLGWQDLHLGELLKDKYQLPVYIANDSQVSALAENSFDSNTQVDNLVLIKVGRGVGSGIILNQQLYCGDGSGAGEIGHIKVDQPGELCRCGNRGCLETLISSRAIRQKAKEIARETPHAYLNTSVADIESITLEDVYAAYQNGDPDIQALISHAGQSLGQVFASLVSVLNIQRIVIAGSMSIFGDGLIKSVLNSLEASALPALVNGTQITTSKMGEEIVMLGAASMVLQHELGII
jgi:predicted NBD/HSP70 family sugar kinase